MQNHSFLRNLPSLPAQQSSTQHELAEKKDSSVLINKIYVMIVIPECYHRLIQVNDKRQTRKQHLINSIIHHLFHVEFM